MISTKKQFHPLDENPRHSNLSLTNQTLCVFEHCKPIECFVIEFLIFVIFYFFVVLSTLSKAF
jgi:hypothetical protein